MSAARRAPRETPPATTVPFDPEFELRLPSGPRGSVSSPHAYQRLVANPFLAVLAMLVWFGALQAAGQTQRVDLFLGALLGGVVIPFFFQYHCLDCGSTGHVARSAEHACAEVVARRLLGTPRRFRGPTAFTQTKLWLLFLTGAGVFLAILYGFTP